VANGGTSGETLWITNGIVVVVTVVLLISFSAVFDCGGD
jgi:hypothetical protein